MVSYVNRHIMSQILGSPVYQYESVDNMIYRGPAEASIKVKDFNTCKMMCDKFDDCKGFTHEQIGNICHFYGPRDTVDMSYHFGHMATFLKSKKHEDPVVFFDEGVSRMNKALETFFESLHEKEYLSEKVANRIEAIDFHDKVRVNTDPDTKYLSSNRILNAEFSDADPVKNYSSLEEIDQDIIQLREHLYNAWNDYLSLRIAHDILVIIHDQMSNEDKEYYISKIQSGSEKSKNVIRNESVLAQKLEKYKNFVSAKKTLRAIKNEIEHPANDIQVTHDEVIRNSTDLVPQVIRSKYERMMDSMNHINTLSQSLQTAQGQLVSLDFEHIPKHDIKYLQHMNDEIVRKIAESRKYLVDMKEHLGMPNKNTDLTCKAYPHDDNKQKVRRLVDNHIRAGKVSRNQFAEDLDIQGYKCDSFDYSSRDNTAIPGEFSAWERSNAPEHRKLPGNSPFDDLVQTSGVQGSNRPGTGGVETMDDNKIPTDNKDTNVYVVPITYNDRFVILTLPGQQPSLPIIQPPTQDLEAKDIRIVPQGGSAIISETVIVEDTRTKLVSPVHKCVAILSGAVIITLIGFLYSRKKKN